MQIPKDKIIDLLRQQGKHDHAGQAEGQLPDQVDPQRDAGLLSKFGLDPQDLIGLFSGGSGGAGGALGGLKGKIPGL